MARVEIEGYTGRCWCGEHRAWFSLELLNAGCRGSGELRCYCGGDFCACHNHGSVECEGCRDCEEGDDDDW